MMLSESICSLSKTGTMSTSSLATIISYSRVTKCYCCLLLRMSKRAIYYAQKALKLPKIPEKDKAAFHMYKVEAHVQLGNNKQALATVKEIHFPKQECSFKCTFGYSAPWIDQSIDYNSKVLMQINYSAIGLTEDSEIQSKELQETMKSLAELSDTKITRGISPLPTNILYSYLRKGRRS